MHVADHLQIRAAWSIHRYANQAAFEGGDAYDHSEFAPNLLVNEGIQLLEDLLIGAGGTAFDNANARLGVGTDATAAAATQTGLLGTTAFAAMEATYPQRSAQTLTWRAVFDGATANFSWQEFTVDNGAAGGINLNRKVSDQGTKASGQIWTLDLQITIS